MLLKFLILPILSLLFISCNSGDEQQIYATLVNQIVQPLPPPPPPPPIKNDANYDSLKLKHTKRNTIIKMAIYPYKLKLNAKKNQNLIRLFEGKVAGSISNDRMYKEYFSLVNKNIDITILEENKKANLTSIYKEYSWFLYLSEIKFNNKKNKAIVLVNHTTGKLSGSSTLYYLEKKNSVWKILNKRIMTIS